MSWKDWLLILASAGVISVIAIAGEIQGGVRASETRRVIAIDNLATCVVSAEDAQLDPVLYCHDEFRAVRRMR
jgi:hypothetical protein